MTNASAHPDTLAVPKELLDHYVRIMLANLRLPLPEHDQVKRMVEKGLRDLALVIHTQYSPDAVARAPKEEPRVGAPLVGGPALAADGTFRTSAGKDVPKELVERMRKGDPGVSTTEVKSALGWNAKVEAALRAMEELATLEGRKLIGPERRALRKDKKGQPSLCYWLEAIKQ